MISEQNIARKMRLMGRMGLIGLIGLMGLMGLGLMGCSSSDEAATPAPAPTTVELQSYVTGYEEAVRANAANGANGANGPVNRAWTQPTGYSLYSDAESPISVFFTQGMTSGNEEYFYKSSGHWRASQDEIAAGTYYLYGYVPHDQSITSTASVLEGEGKTFADGAVLTIENVPTVSKADFCVVIAAKNGASANEDYSTEGLKRGNFEYVAQATGGDGHNYVYLLFDHLFSALRVKMRVQGDYNDLRTIKLKELRMQTSGAGDVPTKKKTQITVTLNKTTDGADPVGSVVFTPDSDSGNSDGAVVDWNDGITLTADYQEFQGHLMPFGVTNIKLISTYDVYDKKGNLIRQNCTATNTINISNLFSGQTETLRGRRYTINLTINPTYLYMLSEPDLNDPTVVVTE